MVNPAASFFMVALASAITMALTSLRLASRQIGHDLFDHAVKVLASSLLLTSEPLVEGFAVYAQNLGANTQHGSRSVGALGEITQRAH